MTNQNKSTFVSYLKNKTKNFIAYFLSFIQYFENKLMSIRNIVVGKNNILSFEYSKLIFVIVGTVVLAISSNAGSKNVETFQESILMPLFGKQYYRFTACQDFFFEEIVFLFGVIFALTASVTLESKLTIFLAHTLLYSILFYVHTVWGLFGQFVSRDASSGLVHYLFLSLSITLHTISTALRDVGRIDIIYSLCDDFAMIPGFILNVRKQATSLFSFFGNMIVTHIGKSFGMFTLPFTFSLYVAPAVLMTMNILLFYPVGEPSNAVKTDQGAITKKPMKEVSSPLFDAVDWVLPKLKEDGIVNCIKNSFSFIFSKKTFEQNFLLWTVIYHFGPGIKKNLIITRFSYLLKLKNSPLNNGFIDHVKSIVYVPSILSSILIYVLPAIPSLIRHEFRLLDTKILSVYGPRYFNGIYQTCSRLSEYLTSLVVSTKSTENTGTFSTLVTFIKKQQSIFVDLFVNITPVFVFCFGIFLTLGDLTVFDLEKATYTTPIVVFTIVMYTLNILHRSISITRLSVMMKEVNKILTNSNITTDMYGRFFLLKGVALTFSSFVFLISQSFYEYLVIPIADLVFRYIFKSKVPLNNILIICLSINAVVGSIVVWGKFTNLDTWGQYAKDNARLENNASEESEDKSKKEDNS